MRNTPLPCANSAPGGAALDGCAIPVEAVSSLLDSWLITGQIDGWSPQTLYTRRLVVGKLLWWLSRERCPTCGLDQVRAFLAYLSVAHKDPAGRFGNPKLTAEASSGTRATYHRILKAFFSWAVRDEKMAMSPMARMKPPIDRPDQVHTFTDDEVLRLLAAAKRSRQAKRDEAIVLLLLDTGMRASELTALVSRDVDVVARSAVVLGKGHKRRQVAYSARTAKALWNYMDMEGRDPGEPVFFSQRREPLTRSGLLRLLRRLGKAAGVEGAHPHRLRHQFATSFIREGGSQFSLMMALGHTSVRMTARYVELVAADAQTAMKTFSPVDALCARKKR